MCTLSWLRTHTGYQVFFNRDELRSRKTAIPPQCMHLSHTQVIMPIDPDGGGSWISVNEHGLSLYLLNYYHCTAYKTGTSANLISRGLLLRSLAHHQDINAVHALLIADSLMHYAPFTLVVFDLQASNASPSGSQQVFQWDGESLEAYTPSPLITSSSVKFEEVSTMRQRRYAQRVATHTTEGTLAKHHQALHASHEGSKNYQSVCMHRKDAKTVSFSHITVNINDRNETAGIIFNYHDGSPCKTKPANTTTLNELTAR